MKYREIVEFDKIDIQRSDVIMVNYVKPSVGTSMEVCYAWTIGKPIITAWTGNESSFLRADDRHGVGIDEGVKAASIGHRSFEECQHEPRGGGDDSTDWREAEGPRVFGSRRSAGEAPVATVHRERDGIFLRRLGSIHLHENSVAARVREDLERVLRSAAFLRG